MEYDEALRVTKESFFSSTGTLVEETSYTYDAAGKRTATTTMVGTQTDSNTYNYTTGYQLDSITGTNGTEDYQFDENGRLMLIQRDGVTLDLEHDAGDRLTSVENETTGTTTEYVYDGQGNRVGAIDGTEVRQFLVAPGMGSGLNSTDLIADGNGNLISNYVYAGGASPFMMLDANGNPVYYLSDGMGSVIGLANDSGDEVGDFRYDSFGNVREQWGGAIDLAGGDFRFQGQWLEERTGIYHFRARDYDAQTGAFLSRDPIDPTEQQPEALNPYQFAYNNPYIYSDPTGMFTITELNATQNLQATLLRSYVQDAARDFVREKIGEVAGNILVGVINSLLPGSVNGDALFELAQVDSNRAGDRFETFLKGQICGLLQGSSFVERLWLEPEVSTRGVPKSNGLSCSGYLNPIALVPGTRPHPNPDSLIKEGHPTDYKLFNREAYLIGDVKLSMTGALRDIRGNKNQWQAMYRHARNFQRIPFTLVA